MATDVASPSCLGTYLCVLMAGAPPAGSRSRLPRPSRAICHGVGALRMVEGTLPLRLPSLLAFVPLLDGHLRWRWAAARAMPLVGMVEILLSGNAVLLNWGCGFAQCFALCVISSSAVQCPPAGSLE